MFPPFKIGIMKEFLKRFMIASGLIDNSLI